MHYILTHNKRKTHEMHITSLNKIQESRTSLRRTKKKNKKNKFEKT